MATDVAIRTTARPSDDSSPIEFEPVIGLEVHAQLLTQSKMYCACSAEYTAAPPNTHLCPVCAGLPGALPVINKAAIEQAMLVGLALHCRIPPFNKFDRKNYVYPDLPKGYQISQYDVPLCVHGWLDFETGGESRRAGITRVHVEEDTGRLLHEIDDLGNDTSLVDLNRSGVPLLEIVGDADLYAPDEARDYLIALRQVLRYIGASTGNMEEGAFRCDANVSIRPVGTSALGVKVEVKNMNSFRAVERALRFEVERQRQVLRDGGRVDQETRGWLENRGITVSQRSKEEAHDYRYFPEPDLPPLAIDNRLVDQVSHRLPELGMARKRRFVETFGLAAADAATLTAEREIAELFESVVQVQNDPAAIRTAANWVVNDVLGLQRERGLPPDQLPVTADQLRDLLSMVAESQLTARAAKEVLRQIHPEEPAHAAADRLNLLVLSDDSALESAIQETLAALPQAVADFQSGKTVAIGRLIGETIKRTGGRARPDEVRARLLRVITDEGG